VQSIHVRKAAELIRAEYGEMPGLQLTFWQAQRLWNLPEDVCAGALATLLWSGFLVRTAESRYRRPHPERPCLQPIAC
jgi:hypothetical protein